MKRILALIVVATLALAADAQAQFRNQRNGGGFGNRGGFNGGGGSNGGGFNNFRGRNNNDPPPVVNPRGNISDREPVPNADGSATPTSQPSPTPTRTTTPTPPRNSGPVPSRPIDDRELETKFNQQFSLIIDDNMFLRERGARPAPQFNRPSFTAPTPQESFVLTGVVFEEGEFHAYFEDLRSGKVTRVTAGSEIAGGLVDQILIDAIAFAHDGEVTWVEFGQNLNGITSASAQRPMSSSAATESAASTSSESSTSAAPAAGSADTTDIAERMRLRRLQLEQGANQ
jgi:hypothetical protein